MNYRQHGDSGIMQVKKRQDLLVEKGVLLLTPLSLYRKWPFANDFTPHFWSVPGVTYPSLAAAVSPSVPVRFFDGTFMKGMSLSRYIELLCDYPVIGLNVVSPLTALDAEITLRLIRKHNPSAVVLVGGHHATFYSDEWIERGADIIVRREGEQTFSEIITALLQGHDCTDIEGISIRDEGGRIHHNSDRSFVENLDDLPMPDWGIVDFSLYKFRMKPGGPPATLETSRGCSHRCVFCSATAMWNNTQRFKSLERLCDELDGLVKLGVGQIILGDDNYGAELERDTLFFEKVLERGYDLSFWAFIRADTVRNHPDFIKLAGRAGLRMGAVGYEAVFDKALKRYNKNLQSGTSLSDYREVYRILHENNIFVYGQFVRDLEQELEPYSGWESWKRVRDLSDVTVQTCFIPMRGVPVVRDLERKGYEFKNTFYHDRLMAAYMYKGKSQGTTYARTSFWALLSPRNFFKMFFGSFTERHFFKAVYRGLISDVFDASFLGVCSFLISIRHSWTLDKRQQWIVNAHLKKYGVSNTARRSLQ